MGNGGSFCWPIAAHEWKSMRFQGKCQPGLTFWRLQPPESGRRRRKGGGRQEIRGDEVEEEKKRSA